MALIIKADRCPSTLPVAAEARWRREEWAYTSGLLHPRDGFALARLLGVSHPSDDETWLRLEDVPDEGGPLWELERHTAAARYLEVFNGSHLVQPLKAPPWFFGELLEQRTHEASVTEHRARRSSKKGRLVMVPALSRVRTADTFESYLT